MIQISHWLTVRSYHLNIVCTVVLKGNTKFTLCSLQINFFRHQSSLLVNVKVNYVALGTEPNKSIVLYASTSGLLALMIYKK